MPCKPTSSMGRTKTKANTSKLKKPDHLYVLQLNANHHQSKNPFTYFRRTGPYITEEVLPNNNYLLSKVGTNKTQVLHSMTLQLFTPRKPKPDVKITPHEKKPDHEVKIKQDDLHARARQSEQ